MTTVIIKYHTKKNGEIKYYASYESAWKAANRLNDSRTEEGIWLFEADLAGWFVFLAPHGA